MNKPYGFLVCGPESSGTRFVTALFIAAGCFGDDGHDQRVDRGLPPASGGPIAWRRSFPHGTYWPDTSYYLNALFDNGYNPVLVIVQRDWAAIAASQVRLRLAPNEVEAYIRIKEAYRALAIAHRHKYAHVEYLIYEALVNYQPSPFHTLALRYGLQCSDSVLVKDGNLKYYSIRSIIP